MKSLLKVCKIVSVVVLFLSIIYFFYYKVCIDDKMEGSLLNGSKIEDGRYFLEDNNGNFIEVEEAEWNNIVVKTNIFMVCLFYIVLFLLYFWSRFLIFPNIMKFIRLFKGDSL